jgi:hypothetical protein
MAALRARLAAGLPAALPVALPVALIAALCLSADPVVAQPDRSKAARTELECLSSARDDFQNSRLALLEQPPPRTIQAIVSERRLEEEYCLRTARCVTKDTAGKTAEMQASIEFSNCLEELALDKYDAKKRDK